MLKHRLILGSLMIVLFVGAVVYDARLDGTISSELADKPIKATILTALILLVAIPANFELAALIRNTGAKVFSVVAVLGSAGLATSWYWRQFFGSDGFQFQAFYVLFITAFTVLAMFLAQARRYGIESVIANCSAGLFVVLYLGLLSSFVLGIRIDFGPWHVLMFIFTVKSADTGAYAAGRLFGRHKFSPVISPGKTWEGIAGAIVFGVIVALAFSRTYDIMTTPAAVIFGAAFAFLGQLGDLAESMIKRDARQKDSASHIPGFGGILDVIDSPLATAPLAYLFFMAVTL